MAGKDETMKEKISKEPIADVENVVEEIVVDDQVSMKNDEPKVHIDTNDKKESEKEVEILQSELANQKDRVLRLSAELENFKKRTAREMDDFRKFANESLFKQLLNVMDNLERAISSGSESKTAGPILEGVQLTHKEMVKFFDTFKVKPIKAEGEVFDPNLHQAVTQQESDKHPDNTVMMELQKGYLLHDRLLRPSMVVVSKKINKKEKTK